MPKGKNVIYFTNAFVLVIMVLFGLLFFIGYEIHNLNKIINEKEITINLTSSAKELM